MPKSSDRYFDKSIGATWLLPKITINRIWDVTGNAKSESPPDWFESEIEQCVFEYLRYAHKIEISIKPAEFQKKCARIISMINEVTDTFNNFTRQEREIFVSIVADLMPDAYKMQPAYHPEIFLRSLMDQCRKYASAIASHADSMKPMREQKTSEMLAPEGSFERPFDRFIEKMADLAMKLEIPVSASKDWAYPSQFVQLVRSTLVEYRATLQRYAVSDWESKRRAGYEGMGLSESKIEHHIANERFGDEFAIRTLGKYLTTDTAFANEVARTLARLRAKTSGSNK